MTDRPFAPLVLLLLLVLASVEKAFRGSGRRRVCVAVFAALVLAAGLRAESVSAQGLPAGEIVVVDLDAGTDARGALFRVDPATGQRTLVSDFGNPAQGPLGTDPFVLAFAPAGLVVVDQHAGTPGCLSPNYGCGALFLVDSVTGVRTLLSDFGNPAQGPTGRRLYGVAVDGNGDLLVTDQDAGASGSSGLLFRVSPSDGTRTIVSDFADLNQGPPGGTPSGVAIEASGAVLVADANTVGYPSGVIFRIDPQTGQRTIVTAFTDATQGPLGEVPIDVEPGLGTDLWVADQTGGGGVNGYGQLFRVDAGTGARSIVSNFTNPAQGPIGWNLNDIKVTGSGRLLVLDFDSGTDSRGALFEVDPATGSRTYLSDFGNPAQGALGVEPSGFALAPVPPPPPPSTNTLTVVKQGTGNGLVLSDPPGIDCGSDCSEVFPATQFVVLTPIVDAYTRFVGWGGDPDCADGVVQMAIAHECIATFQKKGGKIIVAPDLTSEGNHTDGGFDLVPLSLENPPSPNRRYRVIGYFVNRGSLAAGPSLARVYLSTDRKVSADDVLLAETVLPGLPAGPSSSFMVYAENVLEGLEGTYYVILVLDAANVVAESDEKNVFAIRFQFPCGAGYAFFAVCNPG